MTVEEKMRIAIKEGTKSLEYGELPVGAVIFNNDDNVTVEFYVKKVKIY